MIRLALTFAAVLLLQGCMLGPDYLRPDEFAPVNWHAPLPHDGKSAALVDWWKQFDDPLVAELIARAEGDSPTLDQALARIRQSRAGVTLARSPLFPSAGLVASQTRGGDHPVVYEQTIRRGGLVASWEIDLFGGNRRGSEAAQARLESAEAAWHEARISLAADVALEYLSLRTCEARLADTEVDQVSRRATARLTEQKAAAGFAAPADVSLAKASAADGETRLLAQRTECEISIKALVALTGEAEPALRRQLASRHAQLPQPATMAVEELPLRVLSVRPDLVAAERALAAASADIGVAEAARYPRLSLLGFIGRQRQTIDGLDAAGRVWSFGPSLDLPIFDAGRRAANADVARARYDETLAAYKGAVRRAVREVEQALVRLDSAASRETQAVASARHYDEVFAATEQRWKAGLGSQLELEETRRLAAAARSLSVDVRAAGVAAWIGLYRAVGGGWQPGSADTAERVDRDGKQTTSFGKSP